MNDCNNTKRWQTRLNFTLGIAVAALLGVASMAYAHDFKVTSDIDDPVSLRINMMKNVGAATALGGAMVKGEVAYDASVAMGALLALNTAALGMHAQFPEGFESALESKAAPAVWEKPDEFSAAVAKFIVDTTAAVEAKPADLDAFRAVFTTISGNCRACHQEFRVRH